MLLIRVCSLVLLSVLLAASQCCSCLLLLLFLLSLLIFIDRRVCCCCAASLMIADLLCGFVGLPAPSSLDPRCLHRCLSIAALMLLAACSFWMLFAMDALAVSHRVALDNSMTADVPSLLAAAYSRRRLSIVAISLPSLARCRCLRPAASILILPSTHSSLHPFPPSYPILSQRAPVARSRSSTPTSPTPPSTRSSRAARRKT